MENVIDMTAEERDELADTLKYTSLSRVNKTVQLLKDRATPSGICLTAKISICFFALSLSILTVPFFFLSPVNKKVNLLNASSKLG